MRSVRLHDPLDIRFETIEMAAKPGPDEVRVRVAFAGICGSDIHNYKTGQWISRKPSVAGHEFSGIVDTVGDNVSGLEVGNKVIADSRYYCGNCKNCDSRMEHLCENLGFIGEVIDGGFAEFITLPAKLLLKCNEQARLDIAALAEPLAVALHAINQLNINDDDPLLIIGCGPIGALVAAASASRSNRQLLVSDINKDREALVAKLTGAIQIELNAFNQFDNETGKPIRHVLDSTGNVGVISKLVSELSGCVIGLVGIGSGEFPFDPVHLVERELSIVGCHAFSDELGQAVEMLETMPERFEALIGPMISLEKTPETYQEISSGNAIGIKTLIDVRNEVADGEITLQGADLWPL